MRLNEIDYLRPLLFIQLFFTHAFTIYTATSWTVPAGIESVEAYNWIARVSYSCMLELFTFISGYVFFFVYTRKKTNFRELVISKFKRLMIPSILFSILYYLLLMEHMDFNLNLINEIICGVGHLWYLPMLFGCFLIAYFIIDSKKPYILLFVLFFVSAFSRCPNIFRISQIAYYFFFFFLGVVVSRNRVFIIDYINTRKKAFLTIVCFCVFVLSLAVLLPLNIHLKSLTTDTWMKDYLLSALTRLINIIYSSIGIGFWYYISICLAHKLPQVSSIISQFNVLSMGVYVFHQFILMFLYYHTSLPRLCGSYLLPWIAIIIALPVSILFTYVFRLTKTGKTIL